MLRERPFDIYAGQEDVFGPGSFFHDTILFLGTAHYLCVGGGG